MLPVPSQVHAMLRFGRRLRFGLPVLMLCFASAPSLAVRRSSSVRPSRVDAILRRRLHRFYLPEMLQCFASTPSSAVWEPSSDLPSSFGTSQIDAMLRFDSLRRRLLFGLPKLMLYFASAPSSLRPSRVDAMFHFSAVFGSTFPGWAFTN